MIGNSRDKEFSNKQEDGPVASNNTKRLCTSKAWSLIKDPRIVRVSRSFGKKDRHSKVSTIRGLRDRRIRLSVPTAIQLYDLQEKLGLNQPSKVVDWLINVAQHEINVLPPLQMLQQHYIHHPQLITTTSHANMHQAPSTSLMDKNLDCLKDCGSQSLTLFSNKMDEKGNDVVIEEEEIILPKPSCWNSDDNLRGKSKYDIREIGIERSNWNKRFGQETQDVNQVHNPFCLLNHSSHSSLASNAIPHNPYYDHEPSNNSMTHSGGGYRYSSQTEELHHSNSAPIPSSLSLPSRTQLLLYQSMTTPSTLLQYINNPLEWDSKHVNCSQILSINSQNIIPPSLATSLYSISPTMRQFQVNMNNKHQHHQNIQVSSLHKASSDLTNVVGSRSFPNELNLVDGSNSSSVHIQMCVSNEDLH